MRPHISIIVSDVAASVAFYKKVFGVEPQKQTSRYAKFDLTEPALNFSMTSGHGEISRVSHLGIEVDSLHALSKWRDQLQQKGLVQATEENSDCCYARQDKVWFVDPDKNAWEVFYVHEQLPVTETSCCA